MLFLQLSVGIVDRHGYFDPSYSIITTFVLGDQDLGRYSVQSVSRLQVLLLKTRDAILLLSTRLSVLRVKPVEKLSLPDR